MIIKQKTIIALLIVIVFAGCTRQPKCSDKDVKKLVVVTLKKQISETVEKTFNQELKKNSFQNEELNQIFDKILEEKETLINELELKVYDIKTVKIDKEIKKCECEGIISAIEKSDIITKSVNEFNKSERYKYDIVGIKPTIKYSTIVTDDDKLFVNILNIEELEIYSSNIMVKLMFKFKEKAEILERKRDNYY